MGCRTRRRPCRHLCLLGDTSGRRERRQVYGREVHCECGLGGHRVEGTVIFQASCTEHTASLHVRNEGRRYFAEFVKQSDTFQVVTNTSLPDIEFGWRQGNRHLRERTSRGVSLTPRGVRIHVRSTSVPRGKSSQTFFYHLGFP